MRYAQAFGVVFWVLLVGYLLIRDKHRTDYIEPDVPVIVTPVTPELTLTAKGLIDAGNSYPGAKVCQSEMHPLLMKLASDQAKYMARVRVLGHQGFDARYQQVRQAGLGQSTEICAQSWQRQSNEDMLSLGEEMFKCWRQSSGHWACASKKHKYFGADMAKGTDGVWYACILVAD